MDKVWVIIQVRQDEKCSPSSVIGVVRERESWEQVATEYIQSRFDLPEGTVVQFVRVSTYAYRLLLINPNRRGIPEIERLFMIQPAMVQ
jgi:hypothetical protein